jgi:hypothetical protein
MRVITVATASRGYFDALKESCKTLGVELVVLGWDETWRGFQWKSHLVRRFLRSTRCQDPNELLMVVDGYDVLLPAAKAKRACSWAQEVERRFAEAGKPLLLSVDTPRSPLVRYLYRGIFGECRGAHINSGLYAGRVWALRELHARICNGRDMDAPGTFALDDQELLMDLCRRAPDFFHTHVALDTHQRVFCNLIGLEPEHLLSDGGGGSGAFALTGDALVVQGPGNTDLSAFVAHQRLRATHCRPTRTKAAHLWHCVQLYHGYFWRDACIVLALVISLIASLALVVFLVRRRHKRRQLA